MKKVVIAGGSGFLGRALAEALNREGVDVVVLTRCPPPKAETPPGKACVTHLTWDGRTLGDWVAALEGADGVVNLTGKSVDCRYTEANKREIIRSRVDSVTILCQAIAQCRLPPPVFVQAASLAIYGNPGDKICDENAEEADSFSAEVCKQWERSVEDNVPKATRQVVLRISFVLGKNGGALTKLSNLVRFFVGGTVGPGGQYISWLHIDDMMSIFLRALICEKMQGTYNATAPEPATNRDFMAALRKALGRPWSPPVPAPLVRLGAFAIGTEAELALGGRRAVPARLLDEGFEFQQPSLAAALRKIYLQ